MVGQGHVVTALTNALTRQRLHHAYLFTGTRGVGKTTVSRILAKALNCQGPDGTGGITAQPCGVCQACRDIDDGRFPDYTELDAASNRGVDEIQALLEQSAYKPVQGRFKVFMIDEVHMLSNTAFNAMLKTLEEPPEYLKFVLATTDPQKVPVTVLSRCLQFSLRPIAPETIAEHLGAVLRAEGVQVQGTSTLRLLARSARGSMRDALSLTDQAIAFGNGGIEEAGVRQMLGSADGSVVHALILALSRADGKALVEGVEDLRRNGQSPAAVLEEMSMILQRMAVLQAIGTERTDAGPADDDPDFSATAELAALMPADETQLLYSLCLHGRGELGLAPDEYSALVMILLRLLAFKPTGAHRASPVVRTTSVAAPQATSPATTGQSEGHQRSMLEIRVRSASTDQAPAVPPPARREQTSAVIDVPVLLAREGGERTEVRKPGAESQLPSLDPTELGEADFWHETVQRLIAGDLVSALTRELALGAQLVARDRDHWMLRVERESLNQSSSRERLRAALRELGHEVQLSVEVGVVKDSPGRRNALAAAERLRAAEATIMDDPFVRDMVRDFGAKIVPGSIQPT